MALVSDGNVIRTLKSGSLIVFIGTLRRKVRHSLRHRCSGVPNTWSDLIISMKTFG